MAPVIDVTSDDLIARRESILKDVGLHTYSEFVECERLGLLTDSQWTAVDDLHGIAFLLRDDAERA